MYVKQLIKANKQRCACKEDLKTDLSDLVCKLQTLFLSIRIPRTLVVITVIF